MQSFRAMTNDPSWQKLLSLCRNSHLCCHQTERGVSTEWLSIHSHSIQTSNFILRLLVLTKGQINRMNLCRNSGNSQLPILIHTTLTLRVSRIRVAMYGDDVCQLLSFSKRLLWNIFLCRPTVSQNQYLGRHVKWMCHVCPFLYAT